MRSPSLPRARIRYCHIIIISFYFLSCRSAFYFFLLYAGPISIYIYIHRRTGCDVQEEQQRASRAARASTEATSFIVRVRCMNQNIPSLKTEIESLNQRPCVSPPGVRTNRILNRETFCFYRTDVLCMRRCNAPSIFLFLNSRFVNNDTWRID